MISTTQWSTLYALPACIEYAIMGTLLFVAHRWLAEDRVLYKKVTLFSGFFLFAYITGCTALFSLLQFIAPVFLIAVFLLHYKSIARRHLQEIHIFAHEIQAREIWINEIIKAMLYAHYAEKKITIYIMRDDIAYSLFMHTMPLQMPLIYNFIIMLIEGNNNSINLLIDSLGHIRSINPNSLNSDYLLLKSDTFLICTFDEKQKAFSITHANKEIVGLSATHTTHLIQKLLDEKSAVTPQSTFHHIHHTENTL